MYSNAYGYGVYKRTQVNIGTPFQIKHEPLVEEEIVTSEKDVQDAAPDAALMAQKILEKAHEEAILIKKEAEYEAERIIEEAQQNITATIHQVEQQAKEEGYRLGETVAQQHYSDLLAEAEAFRERAKSEYEETILALEQDIVKLSLDIAKKVIGAELETSNELILKLARDAINACTNRDSVVLRVSAEDYDFVCENEDKIRMAVKDLNQLEIRKDQSLERGACLIDTGFGMVDGSLGTKIEGVQRAFFELMGELSDAS